MDNGQPDETIVEDNTMTNEQKAAACTDIALGIIAGIGEVGRQASVPSFGIAVALFGMLYCSMKMQLGAEKFAGVMAKLDAKLAEATSPEFEAAVRANGGRMGNA